MKELYAEKLTVGYGKTSVLSDIDFSAESGKLLCIIGPNGVGKSTLLKTVTKRLAALSGAVFVGDAALSGISPRALAKRLSVMLTDRADPELLTCFDVVSAGRYPYTNMFGKLTPADRAATNSALEALGASALSDRLFSELSDGQKQRVLLARALCQEPRVLVLDEPTAFLDIRFKTEILDLLRRTAREKNTAVVMTLHDVDLALKASDELLCVGEGKIYFGTPEEIVKAGVIEKIYGLTPGAFDPLYGGVELKAPEGAPRAFVISGGGAGVGVIRKLSREGAPFAAGVYLSNDVELIAAERLAVKVIKAPPFSAPGDAEYEAAAKILLSCEKVYDTGATVGGLNAVNARLLALAEEKGMTIERT